MKPYCTLALNHIGICFVVFTVNPPPIMTTRFCADVASLQNSLLCLVLTVASGDDKKSASLVICVIK